MIEYDRNVPSEIISERIEQNMTTPINFEDHHFSQSINTINDEFFPVHFPLHWHKYVEIIAFLDNDSTLSTETAQITVNQTVYTMRPGDILFIWPGELHETTDNTCKRLVGIQFHTNLFDVSPDFTPFLYLYRTFHLLENDQMPALTDSIQAHIRHMLSARQDNEAFGGVQTLISLYEMFMEFGLYIRDNLLQDQGQSRAVNHTTLDKINAACGYIMSNCDQDLTLESVATQSGFSACYFSRVFKQITNYHFVEYLTLQRVKHAQALLAEGTLSITEISYQSGFKSISTFNRVFKQYRNCSPREYRKYYLT